MIPSLRAFALLLLLPMLAAAIEPSVTKAAEQVSLRYMPANGGGIPIYGRVPLDTIMGNLYAKGVGVAQDYGEAARRFRIAAERGDAIAQYNLGVMYADGMGVRADPAAAVSWYRRAAAQDVSDALHNLGVMYASGQGIPKDDAEALKFYRRAAERGHARSQYNLGVMYVNGQGVPRDYVQAYVWLQVAAASIPAAETENRNEATRSRDVVAAAMSRAQLAQARRRAEDWTKGSELEP